MVSLSADGSSCTDDIATCKDYVSDVVVFDQVSNFGGEGEALKADEEKLSYLSGNAISSRADGGEGVLSRLDVEFIGSITVLHDFV
jgi:hypothetical protein